MKRTVVISFFIVLMMLLTSCSKNTDGGTKYHVLTAKRFTLGTFEQDGNPDNGEEDIVWCCIFEKGGKALLVSEYALDTVVISENPESVDFYSSAIGSWLSDFYESSFTYYEKNYILKVNKAGNVFIPSSEDFSIDDTLHLLCIPTDYAKSRGVNYTSYGYQNVCRWFVDCGGVSDTVNCAIDNFSVSSMPVNTAGIGIRPAIWVDTVKLNSRFLIKTESVDNLVFFEGDNPGELLTEIIAVSERNGEENVRDFCKISPETFTETGVQYFTVEYKGRAKKIETFVYERPASIEAYSYPDKTEYTLNEEITTEGMSFLLTFENGEQTVLDKGFTYYPKEAYKIGDGTVTVSLAGNTFDYQINVLKSIKHVTARVMKHPKYGEIIKPEDVYIYIEYSDYSYEIAEGGVNIVFPESKRYTYDEISVEYKGNIYTCDVYYITEIFEMTAEIPDTLYIGNLVLPRELPCHIIYESGYEEDMNCYIQLDYSVIYGSNQIVSGEYRYRSASKTANVYSEITVPVKINVPEIREIELLSVPDQKIGTELSLKSSKLRILYADGHESVLDFEQVSFSNMIIEEISTEITFEGNPIEWPFEICGDYNLKIKFEGCTYEYQFRVVP